MNETSRLNAGWRDGHLEMPRRPAHVWTRTAAAWVDGGLSAAATAQAEVHVAECPRCQALVGVVVRTSEQLPGPEPASTWRRWWTWAVPTAAAATALIALSVWLNVPASRLSPSTRSADSEPGPAQSGRAESAAKFAPSSDALPIAPPEPLDRPAPGQARDALKPASPATAESAPGRHRTDGIEHAGGISSSTASTPPAATKSNVSEAAPSATAARSLGSRRLRSRRIGSGRRRVRTIRDPDDVVSTAADRDCLAGSDSAARRGGNGLHSVGSRRHLGSDAAWGVHGTQRRVRPARSGLLAVGRAGVVLLTTDGTSWTAFPSWSEWTSPRSRRVMRGRLR